MSLPSLKKKVPYYKLILPSNGKEIKFRPYINADKEALLIAKTSEDDDQIIDAIEQIVPACVHESTKIDVSKLPYFDLDYLFLHIVGRSDGEEFNFTIRCNDDSEFDADGNLIKQGTLVDKIIKLEDIEIKRFDNHNNKIHLVDDVYVIMKYPTISNFQNYIDNTKTFTQTDIIIGCTEFIIDGEEVFDAKECDVKELKEFYSGSTKKNISDLMKFFETMPRVFHEFKIINPKTGVENFYQLEGLKDFF